VDGREVREALEDPAWADSDMQGVFKLIDETVEFELYDLVDDPLEHLNLADDPEYADVKADLAARLLAWRKETFDPLLSERYFGKLRDHTVAHFEAHHEACDEAKAKGEEAPYNKIDMLAFQEDWPAPWMK